MVGEELAPFLKRQAGREQQRLVPTLLLPLSHTRTDVLSPAQCFAVGIDPLLKQVPLPDQRLVTDLNQVLGGGGILAQ